MDQQNSNYIKAVQAFGRDLTHSNIDSSIEAKTRFFIDAYEFLTSRKLAKGHVIIDFGCGAGAAVDYLERIGYNIFGVDIMEYWGKDSECLWWAAPDLSENTLKRLHLVDPSSNRLPFDDSSVDFLFSDQTLEHVFDYRAIFAEQARVLKLGGIAIHRFPHRFCRVEPHTRVPLTLFNRFTPYLAFWALLGYRNERQKTLRWNETVESNKKLLATTNYIPPKVIINYASFRNITASFEDMLTVSDGRAARLLKGSARFGLSSVARPLLSFLQDNRILVLRKIA